MKKRLLSIILAFAVVLSMFSLPMVANAASTVATVKFSVYERMANVYDAVDIVNHNRDIYGYYDVEMDNTLTKKAIQRAKEAFIYFDANDDYRPDGSSVSSYIPGLGNTVTSYFSGYTLSSVSAYQIADVLSFLQDSRYKLADSIGVGVVSCGNKTIIYCIASMQPVSSYFYDYTDKKVTASVKTKKSNLNPTIKLAYDDVNNRFRYKLSVIANPVGFADPITLPLSQFNITSTSAVMKYKDGYLYPKKNGSYTVKAKFASNTDVYASYSNNLNVFNNVYVTGLSVSSPKKKNLKATWKYNITDASGYQIQYSTSKNFSSAKTITVSGKKTTSKTISGLKSKKRYYVRARAYINQGDSEKCYTKWTSAKSVVVK